MKDTKNQQAMELQNSIDEIQGLVDAEGKNLQPHLDRIITAATEAARLRSEVPEWLPIEKYSGHSVVLVSRQDGEFFYTPTTAFLDATGVWRVFRSKGGMTPLDFEPTDFQYLPATPKSTAQAESEE